MASHIYTITPEAVGAADGDSPAIFLWHYDEPVRNGDAYQHGPISPTQARQLAIDLVEAAAAAEELAKS
jgi:hypothetical protein